MASFHKNITFPVPNLRNYEEEYKIFDWKDWRKYFSFYQKKNKVNYAYEITDYQVKKGGGTKEAIIFKRLNGRVEKITFRRLAFLTNVLAGNLISQGLKKGERFVLYAPKSIDYAVVLFAAIKCGAIAVPLFEAFGPNAIEDRISDCKASWIFTTKELVENVNFGKLPTLKKIVFGNQAEAELKGIQKFLLKDLLKGSAGLEVIRFSDLEHPFIIHYTSGSTAKPKGILLAQRAMIGHFVTAKYVLDLHPRDRFWNSGDPGWVTGMVYNLFAPLLLGLTAHLLEGPFSPAAWVNFMRGMKINVWYSTPTAFRLLRYYDVPLTRRNLPHLRHIVSAGEPLNPSLIDWTMENLGIPIYDSWYMTENGHQLINNYRCLPIKKGSMGKCLPGIKAEIFDHRGKKLACGKMGRLAVKVPWPGLMKDIWNNRQKFKSYFENGWYISGDIACKDADGYFWFSGREDDMIKSGAERISPFEVESTLVSHPAVAEAAVIGKPHETFGNIVKAFVILRQGKEVCPELKNDIAAYVKRNLAAFEAPKEIEFVSSLPKTRSGKIMRRVLRARETRSEEGDLSTMDVEMNPSSNK